MLSCAEELILFSRFFSFVETSAAAAEEALNASCAAGKTGVAIYASETTFRAVCAVRMTLLVILPVVVLLVAFGAATIASEFSPC